jgi:hypothetical protein
MELIKEADGKTSYTRVTGLFLVPGQIQDFPDTGALLIAGLYGLNKTAGPIIEAITGKKKVDSEGS